MKKTKPRSELPTLVIARRELMIREARAFAWMLLRLVCVAFLTTVLMRSAPFLRPFRPIFDLLGGILILVPLITGLGRVFAWRIALGKAYVENRRFADADAVLAVLSGLRAMLFDAGGEGRFHRATALRALARPTEADGLLREITERGREPWLSGAKAELERLSAGTTS